MLEDSLPITRRLPGCLPGQSESARAEFKANPHVDREAAHRHGRWIHNAGLTDAGVADAGLEVAHKNGNLLNFSDRVCPC